MNLQNLKFDFRSIANDAFSPVQDTSVIRIKRPPQPPAAIHEKSADHDYHQCLTVSKTAKLLDVSTATIHRMLKDGRLHGTKDGRLIRVFQWSLDQYLIENTTAPEIQEAVEPAKKQKRTVKSTSHHVAMSRLESMGL